MHSLLALVWLCIAIGWFLAISELATRLGGYQWLVHLGQTIPVALLFVAGLLSFSAALVIRVAHELPLFLSIAAACLAALHLLNTLTFVLSSQAVPLSFVLLAAYLPTAIVTLWLPAAGMTAFLLPVATLVVSFATIALSKLSSAAPQDA